LLARSPAESAQSLTASDVEQQEREASDE